MIVLCSSLININTFDFHKFFGHSFFPSFFKIYKVWKGNLGIQYETIDYLLRKYAILTFYLMIVHTHLRNNHMDTVLISCWHSTIST